MSRRRPPSHRGMSHLQSAISAVVSGVLSDVDASPNIIAADGIEESVLTATARSAGGTPLAGKTVVLASEVILVDAAESLAAADAAEIPDDETVPCNIIITVRDGNGRPIAGLPAAVVVIAVSGTNNTITQPTGVTNADGEITGSFVSTTAEIKTVTVTVNGVELDDQPTCEVTGAPSGTGIVFASDWGDSLGTGETPMRDGTKWSSVQGTEGPCEVIASTGLDFPTANVFRIEHEGTARGVIGNNLWATPAIGQTLYKRIYWRNGVTSAIPGAGFNHLVQPCTGVGGNCSAAWLVHNYPGGAAWSFGLSNENTPIHRWLVAGGLAYNTTYRVEWAHTRVGANEFTNMMRIYNSAGTLLTTLGDFSCVTHSGAHTMATDPPIEVTIDDPDGLGDCLIGWQGGSEAGGDGKIGEYLYVGGFAVSLTDWCGPYTPGEGP